MNASDAISTVSSQVLTNSIGSLNYFSAPWGSLLMSRTLLVICIQSMGIAATLSSVLRGRLFALLCCTLFLTSSTLWLAFDESKVHEFAAILAGGCVLCATVLITSGKNRRLTSLKMFAGMLTQTSTVQYRTLPDEWYTLLSPAEPFVPTDAMLYGLVVLVPCILVAVTSNAIVVQRHVFLVHSLLTVATLVVRFHEELDGATGVRLLGRSVYIGLTWIAVTLSFDSKSNVMGEDERLERHQDDAAERDRDGQGGQEAE